MSLISTCSDTKIINMNEFFKADLEEVRQITKIDFDVLECYPEWYLYEGDLYYFKELPYGYILNTLIVTRISNFFNLDTAEYRLAKLEKNGYTYYGVVSKNFRDPKFNYIFPDKLFPSHKMKMDNWKNQLMSLRKSPITDSNFNLLIKQILTMTVKDYFVAQDDHHCARNTLLKEYNGEYSLAPGFDYEYAFSMPICFDKDSFQTDIDDMFLNYFFYCRVNKKTVGEMVDEFPYFYNLLNSCFEINLNEMLDEINQEDGLDIRRSVRNRIVLSSQNRLNVLERVLR